MDGKATALNGLLEGYRPARQVPDLVKAASPRIIAQYGEMQEIEVWTILRAEREQKNCEGCKGLPCQKKSWKGYVPKINYDAALQQVVIRYAPCKYLHARQVQLELERRSVTSRIPSEYIGKTFEDYKVDSNNQLAVKAAKKLIEMPNQGVYFYGEVGTGKTLLAAIFAQEVIKQGRQLIFATVPTISMELRSCFKENSKKSELEVLEGLYSVPTLILDDIGMEKPTRFICGTLCNLFNERYNAGLQTIMTSNYKLSDLEWIFNHPTDGGATLDGTRIYDRCKKMCPPIELKGSSRR